MTFYNHRIQPAMRVTFETPNPRVSLWRWVFGIKIGSVFIGAICGDEPR